MDKQLQLFGLMNKAGRLAIGDEPVTDAVEVRQARVLVLAADAGENTVRRFRRMAEEEKVPFLPLPYTKAEFGAMLGVRSVAVAAVCDIGFAAKLLALQRETHPELAEAAGTMQEKAERLREEQKKKRKEQEQAAKRGHRAPPPQKPKQEAKPAGKSEQAETGAARYGKVYGKPSGAGRRDVSIGERRREDARRKLENESPAETPRRFQNAPINGAKFGGFRAKSSGFHEKSSKFGDEYRGAKSRNANSRSFGKKPSAGSPAKYQNKPFRSRSGRANGGNAK